MTPEQHFEALQNMYLAAPINAFYRPSIAIAEGQASIEIEVSERYFHSAGAVHGSVYFKMLDDAAYFAANSVESECFVLTSSFTTCLIRPVTGGRIRSVGRVLEQTRTQLIAEAVAYDNADRQIARGSGVFVRGKRPLRGVLGYGPDRPNQKGST